MQKIYSPEELNSCSRETLVAVILSMQNQLTQLNTNMERLIEQIASANNHRYGRSSEKLDVIAGQLELELIFNEAVFCKHFLEKNAKYFWRMLHLQIGESCKASAGSYSASYIAIADHI